MKTCEQTSDDALAALALIEAREEHNTVNTRHLLNTTPTIALLTGACDLVASLRLSLAAQTGCTPADVSETLRAMFLHHARKDQQA